MTAERVVLAMNAWLAQVGELSRSLFVLASDIVATPPIPERLAEIGLNDGVAISDSRLLVNYYRTTLDGRIAFGQGGGLMARGGRIGRDFSGAAPPDRAEEVAASFRELYPALAEVATPQSWTGPIDRRTTLCRCSAGWAAVPTSSSAAATPGTASAPPISGAACWLRSRSGSTTSGRTRQSSSSRVEASRRSRSASSARASFVPRLPGRSGGGSWEDGRYSHELRGRARSCGARACQEERSVEAGLTGFYPPGVLFILAVVVKMLWVEGAWGWVLVGVAAAVEVGESYRLASLEPTQARPGRS